MNTSQLLATCLLTLLLVAILACGDPLAGFGPTGQIRITVETIGPSPAAAYCVEVEIHDLTFEYQGESQTPSPVLNTDVAGMGPSGSKTFEAQVGERVATLRRAPPINGNCAGSDEDLIPNCLIDGEIEAQQALGRPGTVPEWVVVGEGRVSDVRFTVRCT